MCDAGLEGLDSSRVLPRRKAPTVPFYWPEWVIQRELAQQVKRALAEVGHGRLLDVGCGEKPYEAYRPSSVIEWIGFDVPENSNADVHGYAESLPFPESSIDTVLCTEMLEHVPDPAQVLQESTRVLKPGGHIIITAPFYWPLHEEPYDFFRFSTYGLTCLVKKAGLEIVALRPMAVGFRMVALAVNTCFNAFSKRLPGGDHIKVRALLVPAFIAANAVCVVLAALFPSNTNSVGTAVVARKPAVSRAE